MTVVIVGDVYLQTSKPLNPASIKSFGTRMPATSHALSAARRH